MSSDRRDRRDRRPPATADSPRLVSPDLDRARRGGARLLQIWRYRELLVTLVHKELKVKYKNSALGFFWSLLNPALYLVVFYIVFQYFLPSGIPFFAIFLLSGLLPWNLYSTSVSGATASIVANSALVKKVWFPREVLALASVGAAIVHFFLQMIVLVLALGIFQFAPSPKYALLLVPALLTMILLASALGIALAAANVYLRDTQHLLELLLLAWFWMTPIVYPFSSVAERLGSSRWLYLLNPVTPIVIAFQRAIFNKTSASGLEILPDESLLWYLRNLGVVALVSVALLVGALALFNRLEGDFAEEL